ncbi:MAG TPA: ATP-binding cassette domain-containing protein [Anaeromyxobacter sp.]|nr:ATP-binding cassette domain-containing protein [Anaeromyxobacter sp.]
MIQPADAASQASAPGTPYIELRGITHSYGPVLALDGVDFKVHRREIVGLVGDNGAGKSTLIKILSGVLQPTRGEIFVDGRRTTFNSARVAMNCGMETIYQDMNLIDGMDIMRNIFFGREATHPLGFLKIGEMKRTAMEILEKEITIEGIRSPHQLVGNLSGGQKQAVSIARAMFFKNQVLLLDEPTSALSVRETQAFLDHITRLRDEGLSVVIVTHNLFHAYQVADRFVVLSHGKKVEDTLRDRTSAEELTRIVVGKQVGGPG